MLLLVVSVCIIVLCQGNNVLATGSPVHLPQNRYFIMKTVTKKSSTKKASPAVQKPSTVSMPVRVYPYDTDGKFEAELRPFANEHAGGSYHNLVVNPCSIVNVEHYVETGTGLYPTSYKNGGIDYTCNNGYMLAMLAIGCPIVDGTPYHKGHPKYAELGKIDLRTWAAENKPVSRNLQHIVDGQRIGGHPCPAWRVIGQALNGSCGKRGAGEYPCITVSVAPEVKK